MTDPDPLGARATDTTAPASVDVDLPAGASAGSVLVYSRPAVTPLVRLLVILAGVGVVGLAFFRAPPRYVPATYDHPELVEGRDSEGRPEWRVKDFQRRKARLAEPSPDQSAALADESSFSKVARFVGWVALFLAFVTLLFVVLGRAVSPSKVWLETTGRVRGDKFLPAEGVEIREIKLLEGNAYLGSMVMLGWVGLILDLVLLPFDYRARTIEWTTASGRSKGFVISSLRLGRRRYDRAVSILETATARGPA